jgi:hypothetical protein
MKGRRRSIFRGLSYDGAVVVVVEVSAAGETRPSAGAPVLVQILDTTYQDAPATVLAEARGVVSAQGEVLASMELALEARAPDTTVWAHVDLDGDGRVSGGDYITTQSFPVPAGERPRVRAVVKRV